MHGLSKTPSSTTSIPIGMTCSTVVDLHHFQLDFKTSNTGKLSTTTLRHPKTMTRSSDSLLLKLLKYFFTLLSSFFVLQSSHIRTLFFFSIFASHCLSSSQHLRRGAAPNARCCGCLRLDGPVLLEPMVLPATLVKHEWPRILRKATAPALRYSYPPLARILGPHPSGPSSSAAIQPADAER